MELLTDPLGGDTCHIVIHNMSSPPEEQTLHVTLSIPVSLSVNITLPVSHLSTNNNTAHSELSIAMYTNDSYLHATVHIRASGKNNTVYNITVTVSASMHRERAWYTLNTIISPTCRAWWNRSVFIIYHSCSSCCCSVIVYTMVDWLTTCRKPWCMSMTAGTTLVLWTCCKQVTTSESLPWGRPARAWEDDSSRRWTVVLQSSSTTHCKHTNYSSTNI